VAWAQGQGARGVVVLGFGMGASIAAQFLHESTLLPAVRGVVFDSPVLDLEATSDRNAVASNIPGLVHAPAKEVARLRFSVEWGVLDHASRAGEFDVPVLLLQGDADEFAPPTVAEEFAGGLAEDLITFNIVEGARHETIWNTNPARYEFALLQFLEQVTPRR
jgi:alpha-beta hydrolase superfamily lysophospholipase